MTSTFGPDGAVRQLPEYYVPDAYKEWGVEVVDWTHMTSTLATAEGLSNSVKKFMPTVGCEADAVAFVEESHQALKAPDGHGGEAKTISPEGSYSLGPRVLGADGGNGFEKHRVEACLAGPDKERVRVVYTVQRRDGGSPWKVRRARARGSAHEWANAASPFPLPPRSPPTDSSDLQKQQPPPPRKGGARGRGGGGGGGL